MKKRIILIVVALVVLVGGYFAWKAIRDAYFPIPMKPRAGWDEYVASLDAEYQPLFVNADGTQLEAALFVPEGGEAQKPAIIFSPGSGDSLFSNYSSPGFIEGFILEPFLARDYAVLLVNKRGMGQSGGSYVKSSIEGRAADLIAGVQTLQADPRIDPTRIGLIGHSQGGWVIAHAAAEYPEIAFFISLAGPTTTIYEQSISRNENYARCIGLTGEEFDQYMEKTVRNLDLSIRIGEKTNFGLFGFDYRTMHYNVDSALQTLNQPGLYIFGSHDLLVTPSNSSERLEEIFAGEVPPNLQTAVITGANHSFRLTEGVCDFEGAPEDYPQAGQLNKVIENWLTEIGYD